MKLNKPKNIYFNAVINPSYNNAPAIYDETLTIPLLDNPSEYYCSVVRFQIPLNAIPFFHFPLDINQNNANVSNLILGIRTAGLVKYAERVIYVPNNNLPVPTTTRVTAPYWTNNQAISDYYNVFSISQMITLFNNTLATAITAAGLVGSTAVYSYNSTTQLITLTVNASFLASGASIFMNDACENFLASFQLYENNNPTVGDDFYHVITTATTVEDYNAMSLWFDLRRILVTSNSLPVRFESVPAQNEPGGIGNGLVSYQPILTDFIVALDDVNTASCIAVYNPSAQYRLIDMTSHTPINKVQISLLYVDKFGNQFPIKLDSSQSASVKLGMFHKSLYEHYSQ